MLSLYIDLYFVSVPTNYNFINKKKDILCWVRRKVMRTTTTTTTKKYGATLENEEWSVVLAANLNRMVREA